MTFVQPIGSTVLLFAYASLDLRVPSIGSLSRTGADFNRFNLDFHVLLPLNTVWCFWLNSDLPRVELKFDCHLSTLSRTAEIHLSFKQMGSISTLATTFLRTICISIDRRCGALMPAVRAFSGKLANDQTDWVASIWQITLFDVDLKRRGLLNLFNFVQVCCRKTKVWKVK